ncbi:Der1-like protein, partial [Caulochytrium protostelioides]
MQPWRLVTPFWFQPMGMSLLTSAYFLTIYTRQLEQGFFRGRPADMAFFLVIAMLAHLVLADVYQLVVLAQPLLLTIVYVASQHLGDQPVSFLYGLQFRAFLLPWALAALDLAFSGNLPVPALIGIFVGHAYWYAQVDWPR